jgi:hypothetical protein
MVNMKLQNILVSSLIFVYELQDMRERSFICALLLLFSIYALQPSRLIVRSGLDDPTFAHQTSPRVSPRESTQRRKVEL